MWSSTTSTSVRCACCADVRFRRLQRSATSFWKFLDAVGQGELMVPYTDGIVDRHGLYDEYANWMRQQSRAGELSCGSFLRLLDTHMRHLTQITTFMIQAKE